MQFSHLFFNAQTDTFSLYILYQIFSYHILEIIEMAFGVDLESWPFDETIERKIGD